MLIIIFSSSSLLLPTTPYTHESRGLTKCYAAGLPHEYHILVRVKLSCRPVIQDAPETRDPTLAHQDGKSEPWLPPSDTSYLEIQSKFVSVRARVLKRGIKKSNVKRCS
jgi:hypothetical protein